MSGELVYTSAPAGLRAGSSGFCTVAATRDLPRRDAQLLESLSGYELAFALSDRRAAQNPVTLAHYRAQHAGAERHVLSRVGFAGADHTGRSNKLAHHLLLAPGALAVEGPAAQLLGLRAAGRLHERWTEGPRELEPSPLPPPLPPRGLAAGWREVTGDAGWAGALARATRERPDAPCVVVFAAGVDVLRLFAESLALLPPDERWQVGFSTYYGGALPPGVTCRWRAVLAGTRAAAAASALPSALHLDTTADLGAAPRDPYTEAARTGAPVSLRPTRGPNRARISLARPRAREAPAPELELTLAPASPAETGRFARLERWSGAPRERAAAPLPWATLLAFLALVAALGGALADTWRREEEPPRSARGAPPAARSELPPSASTAGGGAADRAPALPAPQPGAPGPASAPGSAPAAAPELTLPQDRSAPAHEQPSPEGLVPARGSASTHDPPGPEPVRPLPQPSLAPADEEPTDRRTASPAAQPPELRVSDAPAPPGAVLEPLWPRCEGAARVWSLPFASGPLVLYTARYEVAPGQRTVAFEPAGAGLAIVPWNNASAAATLSLRATGGALELVLESARARAPLTAAQLEALVFEVYAPDRPGERRACAVRAGAPAPREEPIGLRRDGAAAPLPELAAQLAPPVRDAIGANECPFPSPRVELRRRGAALALALGEPAPTSEGGLRVVAGSDRRLRLAASVYERLLGEPKWLDPKRRGDDVAAVASRLLALEPAVSAARRVRDKAKQDAAKARTDDPSRSYDERQQSLRDAEGALSQAEAALARDQGRLRALRAWLTDARAARAALADLELHLLDAWGLPLEVIRLRWGSGPFEPLLAREPKEAR